ncbi:MAG: hypothetical protein AAGD11_15020, partial [Planctomycetota bacterium]
DPLGLLHAVEIEILRRSDSEGNRSQFEWTARIADPNTESNTTAVQGGGSLEFDLEGRIIAGVTEGILVTPNVSEPFLVELDFSQITSLPIISSRGEFYNIVNFTSQDGYPPGLLNSYSILPDGVIRGVYTSGWERELGQIELARFSNPAGLLPRGSGRFEPTRNSGTPHLVIANQNGFGPIIEAPISTRYPIASNRNAYRDLALESIESRYQLETAADGDAIAPTIGRGSYRP